LLSLRRYYISRHNLTPKFKIFEMVLVDLEHDFSDVAGIRFWMWLALCAQLVTNGTQSKVSGYYNWGNTVGTMLLAAHLRNVAEDLSDQLWKHFESKRLKLENASSATSAKNQKMSNMAEVEGEAFTKCQSSLDLKQDVEDVNQDFEDHLENIEPKFIFGRPKVLMLWFQLVQWNSSQTITQGLWFSSSGLYCYSYVRGPVVIALAITIASLSIIVMGYTVLPTYALMLHCGEHLRPKARSNVHREANKEKLHRASGMKNLAHSLMSKLKEQSKMQEKSVVEASGKESNAFDLTGVGQTASSKYVLEVSATDE